MAATAISEAAMPSAVTVTTGVSRLLRALQIVRLSKVSPPADLTRRLFEPSPALLACANTKSFAMIPESEAPVW